MNERQAEKMTSQSDMDRELKKIRENDGHPEWAKEKAGDDAEGADARKGGTDGA